MSSIASAPVQSHTTQELLNYFDHGERRLREIPYTIDAQLLNMAALGLDDVSLRIARENAAQSLAACPTELDNRGIYYATPLDPSYNVPAGATSLPLVQGMGPNGWVTLNPYDDSLPTPSGYQLDPERSSVYLPAPVLFDVIAPTVDTVQTLGPYTLKVPNQLTFWIDVDIPMFSVEILITGQQYPMPAWADQQQATSETLTVSLQGSVKTRTVWASVQQITVRGLPVGGRIRGWQMPFNLPAVADSVRPFSHHSFRYQLFPRYWQIVSDSNLLMETYMEDNLAGLAYAQSYAMQVPFSDIAVESNTWGAVASSGASLYYFDRRTPLPGSLDTTALTQEPLYGLECCYDQMRPGSARFLSISPVAYGGSGSMVRWRYLVTDPMGNLNVILPDGTYGIYSGRSGWQIGAPVHVSIPLVYPGTYVIVMECLDTSGNLTRDGFPYPNLQTTATAYDLSALVPSIQGVTFDAFQQLWIWTGSFAIPLQPIYNGYVLDTASHTLFLTDRFSQVQYQ
jgi:hypothetical protein